jgi:CheY-like chemotaxis protein
MKEISPKTTHRSKPGGESRRRTVLVVEDDPISRRLLEHVLTDEGFDVLIAEDGLMGVEVFARAPETVDLVILDLLMPNMNGDQALRQMRGIRPSLPAVVSTGCAPDEVDRALSGLEVSGILFKPYRLHELSLSIADALSEP